MSGSAERPVVGRLRDRLAGAVDVQAHPLDVEEACGRYAGDGYEVTPRLREFLAEYGELTLTFTARPWRFVVTTSVARTLESNHATPRSVGIFARRLQRPVLLVGTAFETEEALLLAGNGDVLLYGDAGFQQVANGFENTVRAFATGEWDRTFFRSQAER
ncbi:SUKH-3 domain-containing protein [Streptacidiphilus griseoplanus]|uniref:SUKH-3 domain-containing protein n=1 Tax=Peterkaempfera griseoplana TaxID=66896 RepID=UPI0006E36316|nr:SUKH-3 domain-containing protein [Peterkaempfera griseoplana]